MLKELFVTHNDFDAAGCAIAYALSVNDPFHPTGFRGFEHPEYKIIYCSNYDVDEKIQEEIVNGNLHIDTTLYMADICCSREMMNKLLNRGPKKIIVIDHHKTNLWAKDVLGDNAIIECDPDQYGVKDSGASLTYKYFEELGRYDNYKDYPKENISFKLFRNVIKKARSYDTFQWKENDDFEAKELQTLFFLLGMQRFVNKYIQRILSDHFDDDILIIPEHQQFVDAKIEWEQENIDAVSPEDVFNVEIKGYACAVKFQTGGMNISELSHQFLTKYPGYDIFIGINIGDGSIAFRTQRDDIDTGVEFARNVMVNGKYGGGHPKASGCGIPEELRKEIIDMIVKLICQEGKRYE